MNLPTTVRSAAWLAAFAAMPAMAGLSAGTGFDYTSGDYGTDTTTTILTIPLIVKYDEGPLVLKATLPYVRAEGKTSGALEFDTRRSGTEVEVRQLPATAVRQSGFGDLTASAFLNVWNSQAGHGLDLGIKAKIATTASSRDFLITSGENDYSIQADYFMPLRGVANSSLFFTFGHTLKGDPPGLDYRDPNYFSAGFSQRVSETGTWGVAYDFREKLLAGRDPVSEGSLFYSYKYSKDWKVQTYGVVGIASDSSPDFGLGATITHAY
ncbi:MAG TPA: hypothetical protein VIS73_01055 [Rhodocyclaceae bacterium]